MCISLPLLPVSSPKPQPYQMEYEAGLVVSGPMTQLEAEIWIQNMENHFGSNLISRKYEVEHALQYFTQSAAIWWKMHHAIQGFSGAETWDEFKKNLLRSCLIKKGYDNPKEKTCACKICGEIGHTQEEHKDGCTLCEENHQLRNAQLVRWLVSCVKEPPTTQLSVTFTPRCNKLSSSRKKQWRKHSRRRF